MLAVGPNTVINQSPFASSTKPALSLIDHLLTKVESFRGRQI